MSKYNDKYKFTEGSGSFNTIDKEMKALKEYYDAMPANWQKAQMANSLNPALSKHNVNLETSNANFNTDTAVSKKNPDKGIFSKIFTPDVIKTALGNVAGTALDVLGDFALQENQIANQKDLQESAARINAQAVQQQAQLQTEGMKQAGLNPAGVNGTGAPSLQAGAAAGGNANLANIFSGMAELVAAAKAPSEIEKMVADTELSKATTGKTEAETTQQIPAYVNNLNASTDKFIEDTQTAKNTNDVFKSTNDFIKDYGSNVVSTYRDFLKATGTWKQMNPKTKETIDNFADGNIPIDIGTLEGLHKLVDEDKHLIDVDRDIIKNALEMAIANGQLQDPKVRKDLIEMPSTVRDEIETRIKKMNEEIKLIEPTIRELRARTNQEWTQASLNRALKRLEDTRKKILDLSDWKHAFKEGNYGDAAKIILGNYAQFITDEIKTATGSVGGAVGGYMIGKGIGNRGTGGTPPTPGLQGNGSMFYGPDGGYGGTYTPQKYPPSATYPGAGSAWDPSTSPWPTKPFK